MKEQDLIDLKFRKEDVTAEESGNLSDYYYYTYDFTNGLSLITNDNESATIYGWSVEFFDTEEKIKFTKTKDLKKLIKLINKNKRWN